MIRSGFILLALTLMVVMAAMASPAGAQCAACAKEGDWSASATAFLEGKPINETPPPWGPKAVRQTNSQFESKARENADNTTAANGPAEMPALQIDLENATAQPSSVNAGSPVMITAFFADALDSADNRTAFSDATAYNVSAMIRDSQGAEAGRVDLLRALGGEYAGIWSGSMNAGIYKVTLVASGSGASRTFDDALQIEVRA